MASFVIHPEGILAPAIDPDVPIKGQEDGDGILPCLLQDVVLGRKVGGHVLHGQAVPHLKFVDHHIAQAHPDVGARAVDAPHVAQPFAHIAETVLYHVFERFFVRDEAGLVVDQPSAPKVFCNRLIFHLLGLLLLRDNEQAEEQDSCHG